MALGYDYMQGVFLKLLQLQEGHWQLSQSTPVPACGPEIHTGVLQTNTLGFSS